jgi:hypothetical protein
MDLGDLDANLGGMDDLGVGDIFSGPQTPLTGNSGASPATNYNIVSGPHTCAAEISASGLMVPLTELP